jgi:hypothetical protein
MSLGLTLRPMKPKHPPGPPMTPGNMRRLLDRTLKK